MQNYTILVVDDVLENIKIVSSVLKQAGYTAHTTQNGKDALRMASQVDYDLILLDVSMPEMSGLEVCRFLKADAKTHAVPVIFLTADQTQKTLENAFKVGGVDYIKKPLYPKELLSRITTHLKIKEYERTLEEKIQEKTRQIQNTQIQLTYMLGGIAEGHSIETHLHVKRVSKFCYSLALLYGLSEEEARLIKDASSLHDVGKLGVDNRILHKEEKLTDKEFDTIKKHTTIGANMLKNSELPLFQAARTICLEHHEKYDGTGYPRGLKENDIHIYARIVAIADVFDALLHARSYKKRWSIIDVLEYLRQMRGKQFDPRLIDLFFANIDTFMKIYNIDLEKERATKTPQEEKISLKEGFFDLFFRKKQKEKVS